MFVFILRTLLKKYLHNKKTQRNKSFALNVSLKKCKQRLLLLKWIGVSVQREEYIYIYIYIYIYVCVCVCVCVCVMCDSITM